MINEPGKKGSPEDQADNEPSRALHEYPVVVDRRDDPSIVDAFLADYGLGDVDDGDCIIFAIVGVSVAVDVEVVPSEVKRKARPTSCGRGSTLEEATVALTLFVRERTDERVLPAMLRAGRRKVKRGSGSGSAF